MDYFLVSAKNDKIGDFVGVELQTLDTTGTILNLDSRFSTDADGIAECLGLRADPKIELEEIIALLESRLTEGTLLTPTMQ
jgi:hypothetical protein